MTMKKYFKISFYILLAIIIINIALNLLAPRPVKFESFNSDEQAKTYLDKHYPTGTDISKILADLSSSGAKCRQRQMKIPKHEISIEINGDYEKVYVCDYYNNFLSLDPLHMYVLFLFADNNKKLVGISIYQRSSIEFP